jgi:hypothetical protein
MRQWEHICVVAGEDSAPDEAENEISIQTYLNQMGRSGWELAAVTTRLRTGSAESCFVYWLKRPCPEVERSQLKSKLALSEPSPAAREQASGDEDNLEEGFALGCSVAVLEPDTRRRPSAGGRGRLGTARPITAPVGLVADRHGRLFQLGNQCLSYPEKLCPHHESGL